MNMNMNMNMKINLDEYWRKMRNWSARKSPRLNWYNYGQEGAYFVTINTWNFENYFGEVCEGKMYLNQLWEICNQEIQRVVEVRKNINIPIRVVMPNHVHLIVEIGNELEGCLNEASVQEGRESNGPKLWNIIWIMKWNVRKRANALWIKFSWHGRYHDHIIRHEKEYYFISKYIEDNPLNRDQDDNNI